jgi:hypothetical protein
VRARLRDDAASAKLAAARGAPADAIDVPLSHTIISVASSWGIPPWELVHPGRPATEAEVARWFHLARIYRQLEL